MNTLVDVIDRLGELPDRGLTICDRRGRPVRRRSHPELALRSRRIASHLGEQGFPIGHPVFLQLSDPGDVVEHFLGAIAAGMVPCCLAPVRAMGGLDVFRERMQRLRGAFPASALIATAEVGDASGVDYTLPAPPDLASPAAPLRAAAPESPAFTQLTSGSTLRPKAVRITHRAALANTRDILLSGKAVGEDTFVSWLPLYHDMGLVGQLLCALYSGSDLVLIRPETFVARPRTWLQLISDTPGPTITTAPNFGYQHCVDAIPAGAEAELDLSRWRWAGCGAERVRAGTLHAFAERFGASGFRASAFVPCYGLAEATLAVTFPARNEPPRIRDGHVSCGPPLPGTEIVVRDEDGRPVAEGTDGEITVRGPGLCSGYVGAETDSPIRDGWLFTGDRGHLDRGELFITGRLKDLIIVDGVNIDPQEIEWAAESIVRTPSGRSAAFGIETGGREAVVVVVEIDPRGARTFEAWCDAIQSRVAALFGFRLHDLVFVRRGVIPKTSSGKVRRSAVRELQARDELDALWRARHPDEESPRT